MKLKLNKDYVNCIASLTNSVGERATAYLFYRATTTRPETLTSEVLDFFESYGLPKPNVTRLKKALSQDKRIIKKGKDVWRIRSDKMAELTNAFSLCLSPEPVQEAPTNSIIPTSLVQGSRSYIKKVVLQINGCYDKTYFDACSVMIRRLVETLLIELFEKNKIEYKIKDSAGNYLMLEGLINITLTENSITLGRNARKGLSDAKWLGDQSAHNRRFIAGQADIDKIHPNIRVLVQELLTLID